MRQTSINESYKISAFSFLCDNHNHFTLEAGKEAGVLHVLGHQEAGVQHVQDLSGAQVLPSTTSSVGDGRDQAGVEVLPDTLASVGDVPVREEEEGGPLAGVVPVPGAQVPPGAPAGVGGVPVQDQPHPPSHKRKRYRTFRLRQPDPTNHNRTRLQLEILPCLDDKKQTNLHNFASIRAK